MIKLYKRRNKLSRLEIIAVDEETQYKYVFWHEGGTVHSGWWGPSAHVELEHAIESSSLELYVIYGITDVQVKEKFKNLLEEMN